MRGRLAAALASGLYGIENNLRIEPTEGNAYEAPHKDAVKLSGSLSEATEKFRVSDPVRRLFGDEFVDHFARTRAFEVQQYRKHVSDFDLARYFEII